MREEVRGLGETLAGREELLSRDSSHFPSDPDRVWVCPSLRLQGGARLPSQHGASPRAN